MVHCFYGCKEKEGSPGEYVVDSQGIKLTDKSSDHFDRCLATPTGCQAIIKMSEKL